MDWLFEQVSVFGTLENIEGYADNIASTVQPPTYNYIRNQAGIVPSFISLSLFRLMPYLLKEPFDFPIAPDNYMIYDMDLPDRQMNDVCAESDIDLYEYLGSTPVHTGSEKKTASFFHLNCAHNEDVNLASLSPAVRQGAFDPVSTSCGSFMVIRRFLDQLKEAGIYDNTTFIIIADHGRFPEETAKMGSNELGGAITGTLIIKPAGAEHGRLQIDSEAEMSNQFFPASILEYAGLPHDQFGLSYQDVLTDHLHPERTIYMTYGHKKELEPETEPRRKKYRITTTNCYTITGDARDFSNWVFHVNNADYS